MPRLAASIIEITDVPEWVQLLPLGTFTCRDGRGPFHVTDQAAILAATLARKGSGDIVIDYDHQSLQTARNGQPAPAAGWIQQVEAREDGIYGKVSWTARAAASLQAKEYRYISPVFSFDENNKITCVFNAALTNNPAIDMRAAASALFEATDIPNKPEITSMNTLKERLLAASALPADASDDALVQKVTAIAAAAAQPDPAKFVPLAAHEAVTKELATLKSSIADEKVRVVVASALTDGKIIPAQKEWAESYAKKDLDGFTAYVAGAPKVAAANTMGNPSDTTDAEHGLTGDELAVCSALGLLPDQFAKTKKEG